MIPQKKKALYTKYTICNGGWHCNFCLLAKLREATKMSYDLVDRIGKMNRQNLCKGFEKESKFQPQIVHRGSFRIEKVGRLRSQMDANLSSGRNQVSLRASACMEWLQLKLHRTSDLFRMEQMFSWRCWSLNDSGFVSLSPGIRSRKKTRSIRK